MALTTLDARTALLVIDLQEGIVGLRAAHPIDPIVAHAATLIDAFRRKGLPVVFVTVDGTAPGRTERTPRAPTERPAGWTDIVAALSPRLDDHRVIKQTWGAFTGTDLDTHLTGRGVTQVVLAGVATSAGVESTARQAHEHGYNVTLATDAMTDMSLEAHDNSVARIFPRLGETGTTQAIVALLDATRSA